MGIQNQQHIKCLSLLSLTALGLLFGSRLFPPFRFLGGILFSGSDSSTSSSSSPSASSSSFSAFTFFFFFGGTTLAAFGFGAGAGFTALATVVAQKMRYGMEQGLLLITFEIYFKNRYGMLRSCLQRVATWFKAQSSLMSWTRISRSSFFKSLKTHAWDRFTIWETQCNSIPY